MESTSLDQVQLSHVGQKLALELMNPDPRTPWRERLKAEVKAELATAEPGK